MSNSFLNPKNYIEPARAQPINSEKLLSGEELHKSKALEETLPAEKLREIQEILIESLKVLNSFRSNLGLSQISLPRIVWQELDAVACVIMSDNGSLLLSLNPVDFLTIPKREIVYTLIHELIHYSDINRVLKKHKHYSRIMSGVNFSKFKYGEYDVHKKKSF